MLTPSWIELSRSALDQNIRFLRSFAGPETRFCSVVKGNAYGHGIPVFVPLAESCGVHHFAVFSADEAEQVLRASTAGSDVMIMGPMVDEALQWAVAHDVAIFVFEPTGLELAAAAAAKRGRPARVHLELETGLNRTGLEWTSLDRVVNLLARHREHVVVEGVCTHLAGAESVANYLRIQRQIQRFKELVAWLEERGVDPGLRHTACSAALFSYPETRMDMVRVGIAQYGLWPSKETHMSFLMEGDEEAIKRPDPLRRVLTWKSYVGNVKRVRPNQFVGYGNSFLTEREAVIAAIPVGYGHGYSRQLSNVGRVLIHGRRMSVAGVVNMSMMMVDVTELDEVEVGDEVVLVGKQEDLTISVASFSDAAGDLNYEMLVKLSPDIPRTIVA